MSSSFQYKTKKFLLSSSGFDWHLKLINSFCSWFLLSFKMIGTCDEVNGGDRVPVNTNESEIGYQLEADDVEVFEFIFGEDWEIQLVND
jgi:hypothetical protein